MTLQMSYDTYKYFTRARKYLKYSASLRVSKFICVTNLIEYALKYQLTSAEIFSVEN